MPFVKFDVEEEIRRQCEKSPEFKKLWEEHCEKEREKEEEEEEEEEVSDEGPSKISSEKRRDFEALLFQLKALHNCIVWGFLYFAYITKLCSRKLSFLFRNRFSIIYTNNLMLSK